MAKIIKLIKTFSKKCSLFIEKIVESIKAFYTKQTLVIANKCKHSLIRFWGESIFWYCFIIIGFAYLFQNFGSLCSNNLEIYTFFDCVYFSVITFHTIGYGDIIPNSDLTKKFIIIESITSVICTGLFVGYLIYHLQKRDLYKKRKPIIDIARGDLLRVVNDFSYDFIPATNIELIFRPIFFGKIRSFSTFDLKNKTDVEKIIKLDFERGIKEYFYMKKWEKEEDRSEDEKNYYEKYYINLTKIEDFEFELNSFLQRYSVYFEEELNGVYDIFNEVKEYLYYNPKNSYPFDDDDNSQYSYASDRISKIVKNALDLKAILIKKSNYIPKNLNTQESILK